MSSRIRIKLAVGLLVLASAAVPARGQGQITDALKDRVAQLIERLDAPKADARDAAEKALIELGPKILPLVPEAEKVKGAELKQRIGRVRTALIDARDAADIGPSRITIKAEGMRLTEVVRLLRKQSGNEITDLREQLGTEVTNPTLDLDIQDKPFFEALDLICRKAELTPNFFTGDGTIGLVAGAPDLPNEIGGGPKFKTKVIYAGPFRILFKNIAISRDFAGDSSSAVAQFEIAWEPRLRPMLMALKTEDVAIKDDKDQAVEPSVSDESSSVVLRPENPVAEMNLNMIAPERAAQMLKSLKVKADITLPSSMKQFRFASMTKPGEQKQGDISVKLESTDVEEQIWRVNVELDYPGQGAAFESYRQGLFNNRIWLQKADGSRFEHNGGQNQTAGDGGKLGFEYLFVDVPGKPADYSFVYETPSKVITIPLEFEYKDVPLP
jgi:hypothetical protein